MTYREIAAEFKQLPIGERLLLLEELTRSLRVDLSEIKKSQNGGGFTLRRGMLKPAGSMPTDQGLQENYVDYLAEKYWTF